MTKRKLIYVALVTLLLLAVYILVRNIGVVNFSNNKIDKSNMIQLLESNHFKFYSKEQDKECLKDLSSVLEDNYTRITNDLHTPLNKKVDIYIYSDLSTYHKAIDQPDAPSWVVGNAVWGSNAIQMVNPLNADGRPYSDFMKVIVHEFTHVVVRNINSDVKGIPIWLNEGVAVLEAEQNSGVHQVLLNSKSTEKFPTLKDLEIDPITFGKDNGYEFSYSIVDYINKTYGYEKLIALIKAPSKFNNILGVSKDNFQRNWIANLN